MELATDQVNGTIVIENNKVILGKENPAVNDSIHTTTDLGALERTDATILGKLLWWKIAENNVTIDQIKDAASVANIPADYLPRAISGARAFKRAMDKVVKESKTGDKFSGIVVTKVVEDKARIVYTIHDRDVNKGLETVDFGGQEKVTYLKESNVISYGEKYTEKIQEWLGICRASYTAGDIRMIVTRLVLDHIQAFAVREKGGVYFAPVDSLDVLENVNKFIALTTGGQIYSFPVFAPEKKDIGAICISELMDELETLAQETAEALEDTTGSTKFTNRMERYQAFRNKVTMYSEIMEFNNKVLLDTIDAHSKKVSDMLMTRYGKSW